jgi:hypothetical protein
MLLREQERIGSEATVSLFFSAHRHTVAQHVFTARNFDTAFAISHALDINLFWAEIW